MKKVIKLTISIIIFSALINAQVAISGKVINQAGNPVKNLLVSLKNDSTINDTTDSKGDFVITRTTQITNFQKKKLPHLTFKANNMVLSIPEDNKFISIDIFNLKGAKLSTPINQSLSKGKHIIPFLKNRNNHSASILIVVIKYGSQLIRFQLVKLNSNKYLIKKLLMNPPLLQSYETAMLNFSLDSLCFIRNVKIRQEDTSLLEYTIPISKWNEKFNVTLDLVPYEVVEVGLNEWNLDHKWPEQVGITIKEYPKALTNYLRKTSSNQPYPHNPPHNYEAWCSEFYSWCQRVGGYALGDDNGTSMDPNWMVDAHTKLRGWFKDSNAYITTSQLVNSNYIPVPGDYVHLSEYGGHSAMVHYVSNDTLYTIEGNYVPANQMKVWGRGHYKKVETLLGYGRRSGAVGNSYTIISDR